MGSNPTRVTRSLKKQIFLGNLNKGVAMVTVLSALEIQGNGEDIHCEALGQSMETGLWVGAISLYRRGFFHKHILTTEPYYKTAEETVLSMQRLVNQIRLVKIDWPI